MSPLDQGTYAVMTALGPLAEDGVSEKRLRSGMSHADAMRFAEDLRRAGQIAVVVHVIGDRSYEVDRYPAR